MTQVWRVLSHIGLLHMNGCDADGCDLFLREDGEWDSQIYYIRAYVQ